jgi:hypothetical protein
METLGIKYIPDINDRKRRETNEIICIRIICCGLIISTKTNYLINSLGKKY